MHFEHKKTTLTYQIREKASLFIMQLFQPISYASLLFSTANAFQLSFYVGSECNGEEVDVVSNVGGTCSVCSLDMSTIQF